MKEDLKDLILKNPAPTISLTINVGSALKTKLKDKIKSEAKENQPIANNNILMDKLMQKLDKGLYVKTSSSHIGGAI